MGVGHFLYRAQRWRWEDGFIKVRASIEFRVILMSSSYYLSFFQPEWTNKEDLGGTGAVSCPCCIGTYIVIGSYLAFSRLVGHVNVTS